MFEEYEKVAGKSIEDSIRSETHGSLEQAMLTVGESGLGLRLLRVRGPRRPAAGRAQATTARAVRVSECA